MIDGAEAFGFNQEVPDRPARPGPVELPHRLRAQLRRRLAQSSIGQNDVPATPLQMAMVAGGRRQPSGDVMTPHVLRDVRDQDGNVVDTYEPEVWTTADGPADRGADARGDARRRRLAAPPPRLAVPGFDVGGKTGTAQLGTDPARSHAWIIGFAGPAGGEPPIAVAVIVEGQPGASEQTGGRVAAPIAQAVLAAYLEG